MKAARDAIRSRLEANWPHASVPIAWPNEGTVVPNPPAPWLYVEIIGEDEAIKAFGGGRGSNERDWIGRIEAHVMVPRDQGTALAEEYADDFAAIFRGLRFSGVSCWTAAPTDQGASQAEDGNWYAQTVVVDFSYRFTG